MNIDNNFISQRYDTSNLFSKNYNRKKSIKKLKFYMNKIIKFQFKTILLFEYIKI